MVKFRCYDIDWDNEITDENDIPVKVTDLPTEVEVEVDLDGETDKETIDEMVVNALSDEVGFCVFGLSIDREE